MVLAVQAPATTASGSRSGSNGNGNSNSNERSRLLHSKLSQAKDYSTFLLGMAEHDPPTVVIPSKGKARLNTTSTNTTSRRQQQEHDDGSSDHEREGAVNGGQQQQQQQGRSKSNRLQGKDDDQSIWSVLRGFWTNYDLTLDNVGSVARDHLANERTFLAWMRTSLALSSIGVAITQLFRLTSSSYTLPTRPTQDISATSSAIPSPTTTIAAADVPAAVSYLLEVIQQQQRDIIALGTSTDAEKRRYQKLGKPIGGTFIILGLVFMALGGHRYISIQRHLVTKNHFPPARRSVLISSFLIMALLVATFASILTIS